MWNIKTLVKIEGKKVLLRTNYDVPLKNGRVLDSTRIKESLPTIKYLLDRKAKIIIISHLGRPEGKKVPGLSLEPAAEELRRLLGANSSKNILLAENLRFDPGEEANDKKFAQKLSLLGDFFVNEAFAASHREHASIVGVPKFFPPDRKALGFEFSKEIEALTRVREKPARPLVLLLGGVKEDKIESAKKLIAWADWVLLGGKLVEYDGVPELLNHHKVIGRLVKSGQDITPETIDEFKKVIDMAKTIVWAGPMGNFYDEKYLAGTKAIAEAVVGSGAFTVVGGGDTEAALTRFGLTKKISFISSGGGAMLAFLSKGDLPGLRALRE